MKILNEDQINQSVKLIREGGLIIVPTNRWYMICCDATNYSVCHHIFEAKMRPIDKPLLLALPSVYELRESFDIPEPLNYLVNEFLPGGLFLKLRWKNPWENEFVEFFNDEKALVNIPSGFFGDVCRAYNRPIASTVASFSSPNENQLYHKGPCISVDEVKEFVHQAGLEADAIVDGGISPQFQHATTVDFCYKTLSPILCREGTIHKRALNLAIQHMGIKF